MAEKEAGGFPGWRGMAMRTPRPTASSKSQRYEQKRYQVRKIAKAEYIKRWRLAHPEAKQKENRLRKERMGGCAKNFTQADRDRMFTEQDGLCGLCGEPMAQYQIDHILPLCKGGEHVLSNAHLVHPQCNLNKGQKLVP